jgi:hypothetical protein
MRQVIPFPKFKEIGQQSTEGVPCAMLLWMALDQLSSHPEYTSKTLEEVYLRLKEITREVYELEP